MKRTGNLTAGALWLLSISLNTFGQSSKVEPSQWRQVFTPFQHQQLIDTAELGVISGLVKGKSLVAVGEVTHGTKQADQLQVKVAMDLCKHHGFTVVVLGETYTAATLALNRYVLFDKGTLEEALQQIADHQVVVTNEIKSLAQWIHDENRMRPVERKIWLIGTEVAPSNLLADALFRGGNLKLPIEQANDLYNIAQTPSHRIALNFAPDPATSIRQVFAQATRITREDTTQLLSLEQGWQRQISSQYSHAIDIFIRNQEAIREVGIFENIKWLKEHLPNPKVVIIDAHNGHVERQLCYDSDVASFRAIKRVGHYLHEAYPTDYFVIGTELQRGYFDRGLDKQVNRVPKHKRKLGTILGKLTDSDYGLLDIKQGRSLGLLPHEDYRMTFGTSNQVKGSVAICNKIEEAFDAIVFIRESQPSTILDSLTSKTAFAVYLSINQPFTDSVITSRRLKIRLSNVQVESIADKQFDLKLQIYVHDKKKRFLKLANFRLQASDSALFVLPALPPSAKMLSMMIKGKNVQHCQIGEIKINNHKISVPELLLIEPKTYGMSARPEGGFGISLR